LANADAAISFFIKAASNFTALLDIYTSVAVVERRKSKLVAMEKQYCVYIMTNKMNTVFYTGVKNNLIRRVYQHKEKICKGFISRYKIVKLVYYEIFQDIYNAISREKQIEAGSRPKKTDLINSMNPEWKDLYKTL